MVDGLSDNFQATDDGQLFFLVGLEGLPGNALGKRKNFPGVNEDVAEEGFLFTRQYKVQ